MRWCDFYELAKIYYIHHGTLNMKANFKTKNGYFYDEQGVNLSKWLIEQRYQNKKNKLSKQHKRMLEEIGMVFENLETLKWEEMYELAKKYYEHYGNLKVKVNFKTKNGYEYDEMGENLGLWLHVQRQNYKNNHLSSSKIDKLKEIGMIFEALNDVNWYKMYLLAKKYYEHYNNVKIPVKFKTKNGYEYDEMGENLGEWLRGQYRNYTKGEISMDRIVKLTELGFEFEGMQEIKWNKMYNLAEKHYEYYGHLKVPKDFKTENGYIYDANGENLGRWIILQRIGYKRKVLSPKRIQRLSQIGMIFENVLENEWNKMYILAQSYYEHYGHLKIKQDFKTKNGYSYDKEGLNLGGWILRQRNSYKKGILSEEQIEKLQLIGMIFEVKKNFNSNLELCIEHNIDYQLFKNQIQSLPYREFQAKINYLIMMNLPIIYEKKLNPIFFTSNINLEVKYGINIKDMIEQYSILENKVKGL